MIEDLVKRLKDVRTKSPVLLIGRAATLFKQEYSGEIITPLNIDEYRQIVHNYDYNITNKLLVFEVFSFLSNTSLLASFLPKLNTPVILLTEDTNINNELLSACKTVIKYSTEANSALLDAVSAQTKWKEQDDKSNITKFYAMNSPELYYFKQKYKMNKYVDLFSTDNVS